MENSSTEYTMKRKFTRREENANWISHTAGAGLSFIGLVLLIVKASMEGTPWHVVSWTIFGTFLLLMYMASTLTHASTNRSVRRVFSFLDKFSIYLLIAGTYTPFALTVLRENGGWIIFGAEWGLALLGILILSIRPKQLQHVHDSLILTIYVLMGWMIIFFLVPAIAFIPLPALILIFAGGICYPVGIIFFNMKKMKFSHLVWHILVILGSLLHWIAIYAFTL